jgi:hypothetical protein
MVAPATYKHFTRGARRAACLVPGPETLGSRYLAPRALAGDPGRHRRAPGLREHVRATLRELHERAALMQVQSAAGYRKLKAGGVFRGRGLVSEQEGAVEFFDIDPSILNRFKGMCVLQETTGGLVRVGEGSVGGQFQKLSLTFSNAW